MCATMSLAADLRFSGTAPILFTKEVFKMNRRNYFTAGVRDGIPICLGYIAVSFTFGIMAKNAGISTWEAVLISASNLTSAGQFAGLSLITASASYWEMAVTQSIICLLYTSDAADE